MNFLYPTFLWALAALAIPIIIHLFNFRRFKKVYFTNVKYLKEVKEETASRSKIKHWLVLLARMLALTFLVLAFAQPFFPGEEQEEEKGSKAVSIYIDNSFSMNARSNDVSLLEKSKNKAQEILDAYSEDDRFQILTNDFLGKHQRILDKEGFAEYLEEITKATPNVRNLSEVVKRQQQALEYANTDKQDYYIISDFQKNIVDLEKDTSINLSFVPLQSVEQQNVYIDSVWFRNPVRMLNQPNQLMVKLVNTGETKVEDSRLTLQINKQTKALTDFNIKAQSSIIDTLNFTITEAGWNKAELLVTDYPISFDDTYYFTFEVAQTLKVLAINQAGSSPYLDALFKESGNFEFKNQSVNNVDYANLDKNQLVILNGLKEISSGLAYNLQQFVFNGGSLLVFPNKNMNASTYNTMLQAMKANTYNTINYNQRSVDKINTRQEVFRNVFSRIPNNIDLPQINTAYDMTSYTKASEQVLLRMTGGKSFLGRYRYGAGKLYLCASSLDLKDSNLPSHALFVPMIHKIAVVGGQNPPLAYTIGQDEIVTVNNRLEKKDDKLKLKGQQGEFIPGQKEVDNKVLLNLNNQLSEAGIYQLHHQEDKPLNFLGFNFNRQESILSYFSLEDLQKRFNSKNYQFLKPENTLTASLNDLDKGMALWKWCLILVLVFLLIETLLLRLWK